jgi:hypothetical protein
MCSPPAATTCSCSTCHSPRSWATRASRSPSASSPSASRTSTCFSALPPSTMSVPRPAMLVAMVIMPGRPAWATMSASRACCLALSTWCGSFSFFQHAGKQLGVLDRGGADQHRLAALVAVADVGDDRPVLLRRGAIDLVHAVVADHRLVGRDDHRLQVVDLVELVGFGVGGAGHAGQLAVHAEVVLEGDRGERLVLVLDRHALLRLDAWCRPSDQRRPGIRRPVNSSTMTISPFCDDVVLVAVEQVCARRAA